MEKPARILDREFEESLHHKADELKHEAERDLAIARKYAGEGKDKLEAAVKAHPFAFVLGAFVGGVLLGSLISKRG